MFTANALMFNIKCEKVTLQLRLEPKTFCLQHILKYWIKLSERAYSASRFIILCKILTCQIKFSIIYYGPKIIVFRKNVANWPIILYTKIKVLLFLVSVEIVYFFFNFRVSRNFVSV